MNVIEQIEGLGPVKVWGPYIHKTGATGNVGRKFVVVVINGRKQNMFLSRWLMTKKLGRILDAAEEVDHIDEDKTNDAIDNLQILTRQQNAAKMMARRRKPIPSMVFNCPVCKATSYIHLVRLRHRRKRGCAGPFCSKRCAAIAKWNSSNPPKPRRYIA